MLPPRRDPSRRARALILLTGISATLLLSACAPGGAQPTPSGNNYVAGSSALTRIPPSERKPAPVVAGSELGSGKTISSASYLGKVVVLNAWASWCGPCRKEAPELQQASVATAKEAQFLGINSRDYDPANPEAFVRATKVTYPSIYDADGTLLLKFTESMPLSSFPSTLILDRQGRIAVRIVGGITKLTLVGLITDTAAGK